MTVSLYDAKRHHCRAIVGHDHDGIALYCGETVTTRQDGSRSSWCQPHYDQYTLLLGQRNAPRVQTKVATPPASPTLKLPDGFITIREAELEFRIPETNLRTYKQRGQLAFREMRFGVGPRVYGRVQPTVLVSVADLKKLAAERAEKGLKVSPSLAAVSS